METMHAAGRRRLPPVPRAVGDRPAARVLTVDESNPAEPPVAVVEILEASAPDTPADTPTDSAPDEASDTEVIDTRLISGDLIEAELARLVEEATPEAAG